MVALKSKFREKVRCVDCGLFVNKPKPFHCKKSGARITVAQSNSDIYCDFFIDKAAYDPIYAGWRGVDFVPAKSAGDSSLKRSTSNKSPPQKRSGITKAEAVKVFKERYEKPIIQRFGKTPYSIHMIDDYWDLYVNDLYKARKLTKEKAALWLGLKKSFS